MVGQVHWALAVVARATTSKRATTDDARHAIASSLDGSTKYNGTLIVEYRYLIYIGMGLFD